MRETAAWQAGGHVAWGVCGWGCWWLSLRFTFLSHLCELPHKAGLKQHKQDRSFQRWNCQCPLKTYTDLWQRSPPDTIKAYIDMESTCLVHHGCNMEDQVVMVHGWAIIPSCYRHTLRNTEYPLSLHMDFIMQNNKIYCLHVKFILLLFMCEMLDVLCWRTTHKRTKFSYKSSVVGSEAIGNLLQFFLFLLSTLIFLIYLIHRNDIMAYQFWKLKNMLLC